MIKKITIDITVTMTKVLAYVFAIYAGVEIFFYANHQIALDWGLYSLFAIGAKNAAEAYKKKYEN